METRSLTNQQKQEIVEYIRGEVDRLNGILDAEFYKLEVRKHCLRKYQFDPGKDYAHDLIEVMIIAELIKQDNGRIKTSRAIPTYKRK